MIDRLTVVTGFDWFIALILFFSANALMRGDIMDVISAAVSRHLPRDLRDDAIQNIWMAVLEGRLKRATSRHRLTSLSAPSIRATTTLGDRARSICRFISRATPR
jgi:hypothetical protein